MTRNVERKRVLGIIGGMGPYADIEFLRLLHERANAPCERDMIHVIYDGNCLRPDRSAFITGKSRKSPLKSLRYSLKMLERNGAEVIVIPCNTAHFWYKALTRLKRRATVMPDMTRAACKKCYEAGMSRVCVLSTDGTRYGDVYSEGLFRMGIDQVRCPPTVCEAVKSLIASVKSGAKNDLTELEEHLAGISCDGFLLACTELSVAFYRTREPSFAYVDALDALACAASTACGAFRVGE